jgi:hypothetical protein
MGGGVKQFAFRKVSREQLAKIAEDIIKALADERNFGIFNLTLDIGDDQSEIKVIKGGR